MLLILSFANGCRSNPNMNMALGLNVSPNTPAYGPVPQWNGSSCLFSPEYGRSGNFLTFGQCANWSAQLSLVYTVVPLPTALTACWHICLSAHTRYSVTKSRYIALQPMTVLNIFNGDMSKPLRLSPLPIMLTYLVIMLFNHPFK